VGKLVLYLADGSTHQVVLEKERITIGRRADNDLCLPHPAVSGEHATVTTILTDSFLEDQGSTHGTLVNGRPIGKHFLRDHDVIDIGKQRIVYLADNDAVVEPLSETALHREIPGLTERVPRAAPRVPSAPRDEGRTTGASGGSGATPRSHRRRSEPSPASTDTSRYDEFLQGADAPHASPVDAQAASAGPMLPAEDLAAVIRSARSTAKPATLQERTGMHPVAATPSVEAAPPDEADSGWSVSVLTGPSKGRRLPINKPEVILGRVGVQVAAIRQSDGELRLVRVEGTQPIVLNGRDVPREGALLRPGDVFDVAGARLELVRK